MPTDLRPTFKKSYPEGSKGGQCAVFVEALILMPTPSNLLGNSLASKKNKVQRYGITLPYLKGQFQVGDVIIETYQPYGHVCIVNFIDGNYLYLSESNFHLDGKVHHTRIIHKDDPHIFGVLRGTLKVKPI